MAQQSYKYIYFYTTFRCYKILVCDPYPKTICTFVHRRQPHNAKADIEATARCYWELCRIGVMVKP